MPQVKTASSSESLIEAAEHDAEDDRERSMEPANRIDDQRRVLGNGCAHPGMSELKQDGASGAQKDCRLPIDAPCERVGSEYSLRAFRLARDKTEPAVNVIVPIRTERWRTHGRGSRFQSSNRPRSAHPTFDSERDRNCSCCHHKLLGLATAGCPRSMRSQRRRGPEPQWPKGVLRRSCRS